MATKSSAREKGEVVEPNQHARLPIQLERLPFATLDPSDGSRDELSLSLAYGDQVATWHASALDADGGAVVLPGPFGNDVWVALGRVWNGLRLGERDLNDPQHRTIALGYVDLLRLMAKTPSQTVYAALEETVDRLGSVWIVAQGTWKDGEYVQERVRFPLFDSTRTRTRRDGDEGRNVVTFRLSLEVAKALVQHSRLLNVRELYRLKSPTARRLYRLLEAERFNRDRQGADVLTLSLSEIRSRMPLSEVKPAQLKRTLGRAHAELHVAGLLADAPMYASTKTAGVRAPVVSVTYHFPTSDLALTRDSEPASRDAVSRDYPGRAELAALLGVTADSTAPSVSDLAWWVGEIERTLGDRRSSGFYKQVAEAFAAANALDALEFVLRGVQRDGVGMPAKALGSAFTARVKARARELNISFPDLAAPSNRTAHGAGMARIGALLPDGESTSVDPPDLAVGKGGAD